MKNILLCICCALVMISVCVIGSTVGDIQAVDAETDTSAQTTEYVEPQTKPQKEEATEAEPTPIEAYLAEMTLDEKVGQLFIVTPDALLLEDEQTATLNEDEVYSSITALNENIVFHMSRYHIGGIIMFASNITDPEQISEFNESIMDFSRISPFICIDEEGGIVARIANNDEFEVPQYDSMREVGDSDDLDVAEAVGEDIGGYLRDYGFNLDLAPVADLDAGNRAIGSRAFSDGPRLTGNMVKSEIAGFHRVGVMCCTKHFPGHGSALGDTHMGEVEIEKDWEELCEYDIVPFKYAIAGGTDMIMVSHLTAPYVTGDDTPSSLSYIIITEKLRNELGYTGVVITDAFAMQAISDYYSSGEAAVMSLKAGADIILMPQSIDEAYNAVKDAVKSGEITEEELDEHLTRILALKEKYGLISFE